MLFSVIVPVYNCEGYVENCIKSIQAQSFSDWELILVNDGSKDNSLAICQGYAEKDARIRVIDQPNGGAGPARNNGIANARGEYLVFCDADDYYDNSALEKFKKAIQKSKSPDLVICGYREWKQVNGRAIIGRRITEKEQIICDSESIKRKYYDLYRDGMISAPWAKAYKNKTIKECRIIFPDLRRNQDVVFNLRYYGQISTCCITDDVVYNYQTPEGNVYIEKFPIDMFDIVQQVYRLRHDVFKEWGNSEEAETELNSRYVKDMSIILRLNFYNHWDITKDEQMKLSKRVINDDLTQKIAKMKMNGTGNKVFALILRTKSLMLVNLFSFGTLLYQKTMKKCIGCIGNYF